MPLESVSGTDLQYYLVSFDADGQERQELDGSLISKTLLEVLRSEPITDVFIFSHGWMGDVPAARKQYGRWIKAMAMNEGDRAQLNKIRPNFKPLMIGLQWPSLPWGDDSLEAENQEAADQEAAVEAMVSRFAPRVADTAAARGALRTIFTEGMEELEPDVLSPTLIEAYTTLNAESGLGSEGAAAAPGCDREPFDAEAIYEESEIETELMEDSEAYGLFDGVGSFFGRVFAPLRVLSYWKMKDRARDIGEQAGFKLLSQLQHANAEAKFHLMGHSFGCIVMSATLAGPENRGVLPRPVSSLTLVQGALSLWGYCADIPKARGTAGYFYPLVRLGKVAGPIVTTHSDSDAAVGKMYPLASGVAMSSLDFAPGDWPRYGAIGAFGIQGDGVAIENLPMRAVGEAYNFEAGKIYNLEASEVIKVDEDAAEKPGPLTGSHNEIDKPEVAHAVWSAAMVG